MKQSFVLAGVLTILIPVLVYVFLGISYRNAAARNRIEFTAQEQRIEASFDEMWKTIQQTAEVDQRYRQDVMELVRGYASDRGGTGGAGFAQLLTEAVPDIDPNTANRLMGVIDGRREGFKRDQNVYVGIASENNKMVATFPGSLFLTPGDLLEAKIVSSGKTQEVMQTRAEESVSVYGS